MDYAKLSKEDFDAVVTGELTHYALWLEDELNMIIADYFVVSQSKMSSFKQLLLYRDGLTFQDKIEIVRGMLPLFQHKAEHLEIKKILNDIEEFKAWRNALAHGLDVSQDLSSPHIMVEVVSRSGKKSIREITPETHESRMADAENLLARVQYARRELNA